MTDITPVVPIEPLDPYFAVDSLTEFDLLYEQLELINTNLSYIFSALLWVIIFMVCYMLYRFLHRTLFMKNDLLD